MNNKHENNKQKNKEQIPPFTVLKRTPYYTCQQVPSDKPPSAIHQYHFQALANPFTPLLNVFYTLTIPTPTLLNKELVEFIIKCIQVYRDLKKQEQLQSQFFPKNCSSASNPIRQQFKALAKKSRQELSKINLQHYPSSMAELDKDLQYYFQFTQRNLSRYQIIPRDQKLFKITKLAVKLQKTFNLKLIIDKQQQTVVLQIKRNKSSTQILTVEELCNKIYPQNQHQQESQKNKTKKTLISYINELEEVPFVLFKEIVDFHQNTNMYFKELHKQYFSPHPNNVIVQIQETPFCIVLDQDSFSIDLVQIFLNQLGLEQRPQTLEQLLLHYSTTPVPPLTTFDFRTAIQALPKDTFFDCKQYEVQSILSWLLVSDYIIRKFAYSNQVTAFDQNLDSSSLLNQMLKSTKDCFVSQIELQTSLYQMQSKQQSVLSFTYRKWKNFCDQDLTGKQQYFQKNKFIRAQMHLNSLQTYFFQQQQLKSFIQKNHYFNQMTNIARYLFMYLLCKYAEITVQENILNTNSYKQQNIFDDRYQIKILMERFKTISNKIQKKIEEDYLLRKTDQINMKFILSNQEVNDLFKKLRNQKIEKLQNNITTQQKQNNNFAADIGQIQTLKEEIKSECLKLLYYRGMQTKGQNKDSIEQLRQKTLEILMKEQTPRIFKDWLKNELIFLNYFNWNFDEYPDFKQYEADIENMNTKIENYTLKEMKNQQNKLLTIQTNKNKK